MLMTRLASRAASKPKTHRALTWSRIPLCTLRTQTSRRSLVPTSKTSTRLGLVSRMGSADPTWPSSKPTTSSRGSKPSMPCTRQCLVSATTATGLHLRICNWMRLWTQIPNSRQVSAAPSSATGATTAHGPHSAPQAGTFRRGRSRTGRGRAAAAWRSAGVANLARTWTLRRTRAWRRSTQFADWRTWINFVFKCLNNQIKFGRKVSPSARHHPSPDCASHPYFLSSFQLGVSFTLLYSLRAVDSSFSNVCMPLHR